MGHIISANARPDAILADVLQTMINASSEGGVWHLEAQQVLGKVAHEANEANETLREARETFEVASSALAAASRAMDLAVASARDDVWNKLGRPAANADLVLAFPSPMRPFFDLDPGDKPARVDLIAAMLERGSIRRIPRAHQEVLAADLRDQMARLSAACEVWKAARDVRDARRIVRDAQVRVARIALVCLKRVYKNHGLSEADIHRVIPDRKRSSASRSAERPQEAAEPEAPLPAH